MKDEMEWAEECEWLANEFMKVLPELVELTQRTHCIALTQTISREELKKLYPTASD